MARINLFEIIELKNAVKTQFDVEINSHDTCGGMFFELEQTNDLITEFLYNYFLERKLGVIFNDEKTEFRLVDIEQC